MTDWSPDLADKTLSAGGNVAIGGPAKWDATQADERMDAAVKGRLEASARQSQDRNPAEVSRANGLARQAGLPTDVVYHNLPDFEARDLADKFWAATPNVKAFLSNPNNAAIAKDDVALLSQIEDGWGTVSQKFVENIPQRAKEWSGGLLRMIGEGGGGLASPAMIGAQLKALERAKLDPTADINALFMTALKEDPTISAGTQMFSEAQAALKANAPNVPEWSAKGLSYNIASGAVDMIPAIAAGTLLRSPEAGAAIIGGQVLGDKYGKSRADGRTINQAGVDAAFYALAEAIPETISLGKIMEPGGKLAANLFKAGISEGVQEMVTEVLQRGYDSGIIGENMTWGEAVNGVLMAGVTGAGVGVGLKGAHHGLSRLVKDDHAADLAKRTESALAGVKSIIDQTKIATTDPEALRGLIKQIAGEDGKLYLPADQVQALYQSGHLDDFALQDWDITAQLPEALATGGDVVVDADKFLTARTTPEQYQQIIGHVRTEAAGMTPHEASAWMDGRDETVARLMDSISEQYDTKAPGQFVYDDIVRQAKEAGRGAQESRALALAWQHRYETRAARMGGTVDPDQLYAEDNVTLAGPKLGSQTATTLRDNLDVVIARLKSGNEVKTAAAPMIALLKSKGGVAPVGALAAELKAMGVTPKSYPGLYRKGGLTDVDTIVTSEHPILADNAFADAGNGYARPQAILDAIGREVAGQPLMTAAETQQAANLDGPVAQLKELMDRMGFDFAKKTPAEIRTWIDQTEKEMAGGTVLTQAINAGVDLGRTVNVIDINAMLGGKRSPSDLIERLKTMLNKPMATADESKIVQVLPENVRHIVFSGAPIYAKDEFARNKSVFNISSLLEHAVLIESGLNTKATAKPDVVDYHRFYVPISDMGKVKILRIVAQRTKTGLAFNPDAFDAYDLVLENKKGGPQISGSPYGSPSSTALGVHPSEITIRQMLAGVKGMDGTAYFQAEYDQRKDGTVRGSYVRSRDPYGNISNLINFTTDANRTTFLHESGHFWLFQLVTDAFDSRATPEAQDKMKADIQAALKWMGVKIDVSKAADADVILAVVEEKHHEQWARGFEAYMLEGRAPSVELRDVFVKFSSWLVSAYKKLTGIPGYAKSLKPEVREVMDRLMATDSAIEEARNSSVYKLPAEITAVLTEQERKNMEALLERAGIQARADLQGRVAKDLKREKTEWWKSERAKVEAEVSADVRARPPFRAINLLRSGVTPDGSHLIDLDTGEAHGIKLDRAGLIADYGAEIIKMLPAGILSKKGETGVNHHIFASMVGFSTAEDLKLALLNAGDQAAIIKQETDAKMAERHGSVMEDLESEAADVVANDKQLELVGLQVRYLRRLAGDAMAKAAQRSVTQTGAAPATVDRENVDTATRGALLVENANVGAEAAATAQIGELAAQSVAAAGPAQRAAQAAGAARTRDIYGALDLDAIKEAARQLVRSKTVRQVTPDRYRQVANTLAKKVEIAVAKRDYALAAKLKEQQLLNLYLAREAKWGQAYVDKAVKKFARINKNDQALARGADIDFMKAARAVLAPFGLARPDAQFSMGQWLKLVGEADPAAAADFRDIVDALTVGAMPYQDMTLANFMELKDSVDALMKMGRDARSVELNGERLAFSDIINEAEQQLSPRLTGTQRDRTPSKNERLLNGVLGVRALLTRVETWARGMDNGKNGVLTRLVFMPVARSVYAYRAAKLDTITKLRDILLPARGDWNKPVEIKATELGHVFRNKGELIHAILHTGNDSNMRKLIVGWKWGQGNRDGSFDRAPWDAFFGRMVSEGTITKSDMDMVQAIWDLLEGTKGPAQQAHRKMFGYYFTEIQSRPIHTPFGIYRGGYVPAVTDKDVVNNAGSHLDADALAQGQNAAMFPGTARGFTKGRVDYNKELALDLMMLPSHVDKVLKFTHIGPVVREVARLVKRTDFGELMGQVDRSAVGDLLIPWLQRSASQSVDTPSTGAGGRFVDNVSRYLRKSTGLQMMVGNIVNAVQQVTGISAAAVRTPVRFLARAMISSRKDPDNTMEGIMAKSAYMTDRAGGQMNDISQDIADILADTNLLKKGQAVAGRYGYFAQTITQNVVDRVVWLGSYEHAIEQGKAEADAVESADSVVRTSQGTFAPEDVSGAESGSPFVRLFSQFYSFFNSQANLAATEAAIAVRELGWKGARGKLFSIYLVTIFIPSIVADAIAKAASGDLGDADDDGIMDDLASLFLLSQVKYLTAMVPGVGHAINYGISLMNKKAYDDKISTAPAISALEKSGRAFVDVPKAMFFGGDKSRAFSEFMTLVGMASGIPTRLIERPVSYAIDVAEGDSRPRHPGNIVSGILTGRDGTAQH